MNFFQYVKARVSPSIGWLFGFFVSLCVLFAVIQQTLLPLAVAGLPTVAALLILFVQYLTRPRI